jgi:L-alanine-DL-glutamate epimerase-like enolase superfamily enzyme
MGDLRFRLMEGFLRYPPGQEIHTAASGRIEALRELYLVAEDRGTGTTGQGEVRSNIAFITGTPEAEVAPSVIALCETLGAEATSDTVESAFGEIRRAAPKIAQALVENTLVDLASRRNGVSVAAYLGGSWRKGLLCNECVFWGSDEDMSRNMALYRSLGFRKIKVRVGIGSVEDDVRRLAWLRNRYGSEIELAADANGAWEEETALRNLDTLRQFDLRYIEQPTRKGDWDALERVADESGYEVMVDEGLQTDEDVARVCANQGRISAHLKIAKAGGVAAMVGIGRRFDRHGVSYVVGQMNEGALATAIAVQGAMALSPRFGELYGALGIENDPADGVTYRDGEVSVPDGPGAGVSLSAGSLALLWDSDPR